VLLTVAMRGRPIWRAAQRLPLCCYLDLRALVGEWPAPS